ncbi:integrase, catalytic region, zinc finger, CCHC-type containing protein [Tanacetum coccineum]
MTKMLLAKKDSDEQVLLAEDQAWMESSSDSDQEINANMVFMAKMEKVLSRVIENEFLIQKNLNGENDVMKLKKDCPDLSLDHRFGMLKAYDRNINLLDVAKFCNKGLEVAFRKSTCFVRNEDGVDLLIGDRSSNLYTIALNEIASNSLACLLAKASSLQSWLWHQRLSHLNFATINNLVKKQSCSRSSF